METLSVQLLSPDWTIRFIHDNELLVSSTRTTPDGPPGNKMSMSAPTTPVTPGAEQTHFYEVITDYVPEHDGEIRLTVGDIITSAKDLGNGWTLGKNVSSNNMVGIFPSTCVRLWSSLHSKSLCSHYVTNYVARDAESADLSDDQGIDEARSRMLPGPPAGGFMTMIPDGRKINIRYATPLQSQSLDRRSCYTAENIWSPASDENITTDTVTTTNLYSDSVNLDEFPSVQQNEVIDCRYMSDGNNCCRTKPKMIVKPNLDRHLCPEHQKIHSHESSSGYSSVQGDPYTLVPRCRIAAPPCELHIGRAARGRHSCGHFSRNEQIENHRDFESEAQGPRNEFDLNSDYLSTRSTADSQYDQLSKNYNHDYRSVNQEQRLTNESLTYKLCDAHSLAVGNHGYLPKFQEESKDPEACCVLAPETESISYRIVFSTLVGQTVGLILFLWMFYQLGYWLLYSVIISIAAAATTGILLAVSRICRCIAAISLPSLCTIRGRLAFLIIITGFLLNGPVSKIYVNMSEISRSMSCSAEQSYNQTNFLLRPFDAMMRQLNVTIGRLQDAAYDVTRGLRPLDEGLADIESDLYNGKLQLLGTRKTCKGLIDRAFNACANGIFKAQDQCLGVMGALGIVYHHARFVLDKINPDRWSSLKQAAAGSNPGGAASMTKRQAIDHASIMKEMELPASDRDICEPLDTLTVCQALNDSESLCQPSRWAGEAIQEAINATQRAMLNLQGALQFYFTSEPYSDSRTNVSANTLQIRRRVQEEFLYRTDSFELVISILKKLVPLALFLLLYSSYTYLKQYMSRDTYDNIYVSSRIKYAVRKKSVGRFGTGENIYPLKRYERRYLVDTSSWSLGVPEIGLYRSGLCIFFLHIMLSTCCYTFDYVLYWVLSLVKRHGRPGFDPTGGESLELVITGEGIIVELLDVFLKSFHTNHGFGFVGNTQACLPLPRRLPLINFIFIIFLYVLLLMSIILKAYILRFRNSIAGYFYRERENSRLLYLYSVIIGQRARLPRILHHTVRANYQQNQSQMSIKCFSCLIGCCSKTNQDGRCGRFCCGSVGKCLVCDETRNASFRVCETDGCRGLYCLSCFDDLYQVCPLCLNQPIHQAATDKNLDDDDAATIPMEFLGHSGISGKINECVEEIDNSNFN